MLVVMEWFNAGHSIYRTHSRTLEAARELFHVIGMGLSSATDAVGHAVFDEWIEVKPASLQEQTRQIRGVADARQAQIFYMPSVGMFPLTMMLTNIRLAPVMAMALGHPATTHSEHMDYVVVEEDYVGDPACFSEQLLILPNDGMPYRPSGLASESPAPPIIRENPEVVDIIVAASAMKINPGFLNACKVISERSKVPVKFHFAVAFAQGMVFEQVKRVIANVLGNSAVVYSHRGYVEYMDIVRKCDMFINPFPFGNTNGIIDTVTAGLVGICKTGNEVNEHIDQGLFERFGLPNWLVATDTERYIKATIKLVENHELRNELRRKHAGPEKVERIFQGRPQIMGQLFMGVLQEKIA
jgi:predicted O-linked N-acetylglucosamine transferase (SPINDLY family)